MDCLVYTMDPHPMMKTTGPLAQKSVGDRKVPTCEACPVLKGGNGRCTPSTLSPRLLGWWEELFRCLYFSTFMLSVFRERKDLSFPPTLPPEKHHVSPPSPQKAGFLWGLKASPPVRINPVVSSAFCLHSSWQYRVQNVSGILHCQNKGLF